MVQSFIAALFLMQAVGANTPSPRTVAAPLGMPSPTPPPEQLSASSGSCVVKALTPVELTVLADLASDKNKPGDRFQIALAEPLDVGNGVVIPAGTRGEGEVVHAAKARGMGKAGELVLAAGYLDYRGTKIPLRSFECGAVHGTDRTGETVAVDVLLGPLLGALVTGGEVRVLAGTRAHAKVRADVIIPNAPLSSVTTGEPPQRKEP